MIAQNVVYRAMSRLLWVVLGLLLLPQGSRAQSIDTPLITPRHHPEMASSSGEGVSIPGLKTRPMRVDVNLVLVPVTVIDSFNRPVIDLPQQDFSLLEGGVPQKIQFFSREDAPISIALVLDFSGSMRNKVDYVRQGLDQFFQNANPEDDYYVITVSDHPSLVADASQSVNTID